jgi:phosphoglycolate phosphatase
MYKLPPLTDVIFDLDGTLVDSAPSILLCLAAALASQGITPIVPLSSQVIGPPLRQTLRNISGCNDDKTIAAMAATFVEQYDQSGYRQTQSFPGVEAMLQDLKDAGLRLHIATNKRLKPTQLILSHLGWNELFCEVYALDKREPSFPNKSQMLEALLQDEGIPSSDAIYIGDRSDDWKAARANEVPFFAAVWGYRDVDLLASREDLIAVESPEHILRAIKRA